MDTHSTSLSTVLRRDKGIGMPDELDEALSIFDEVRPRLFGLAYRMLGSIADAEDVVQSAWIRWQAADRREVVNPAAFLVTVATRLAINMATTARSRREGYIGPWLPEPVDTGVDAELGAERGEALELAVLLLLEKLRPTERAAYVLREAFDYPYERIANILQVGEANARQLVTRARKHIANGRRAPVSPADQQGLLRAFIAAAQQGDVAELESLFAADVVSYSDGGGIPGVARKPVYGRDAVARFTALVRARLWVGTTYKWIQANGRTCVLVSRDGAVYGLGTISGSELGIDSVMWMMNPAKISAIARAAGAD